MATQSDPLSGIVYKKIPENLYDKFGSALDRELLIPVEKDDDGITLEAIIAGMLRVLIHDPGHQHASSYRAIVKALRPDIKDEFTKAGMLKASIKDFDVAVEIFQALVGLFPDCGVCSLNLALVYHDAAIFFKNNPDYHAEYTEKAFNAYRTALALDNAPPELHANYGYFLLEQENFDKALAHFEEYLVHETNETKRAPVEKLVATLADYKTQDVWFKEAFDYISMGREEEGIQKAGELLKRNPDFWNGWFLLGCGQRRLGRYPEAKESFLKARSLTSPNSDLLNELAIVLMELGELDESYLRLIEAIKLDPENIKILSNLGIISLKRGREAEAAGYFRTVLEFEPGDEIAKKFLESIEIK